LLLLQVRLEVEVEEPSLLVHLEPQERDLLEVMLYLETSRVLEEEEVLMVPEVQVVVDLVDHHPLEILSMDLLLAEAEAAVLQ
jgi:hypothetical protein